MIGLLQQLIKKLKTIKFNDISINKFNQIKDSMKVSDKQVMTCFFMKNTLKIF